MIVLDTSALVFWTVDSARLSDPAKQALGVAERHIVSSISIWELALKVKQGRLTLPLSIDAYLASLTQISSLEILPVDVQTWILSVDLPWDHKDPADRVIVATATQLDCPLVSSDGVIARFYPRTIW
jgi:PIN domain nuclease of toxin-antitoxin system